MMKIVWSFLPCLSSLRRRGLLYSELEGTLYYVFSRFGKRNGDDHAFQVFFCYESIENEAIIKIRMMSIQF